MKNTKCKVQNARHHQDVEGSQILWSRIFDVVKGMVTLGQDSSQLNIWICSFINVNCVMLGIIITWLLFSSGGTKKQVCVKLRRDGSWFLFWVFNLIPERKSLGPGMVLHDFYPRVQETEPWRSLSSRLFYWASSRTTKLRQWSLLKNRKWVIM